MSEYTGLNFLQIQELDYYEFLILRRDAFITKLSTTEKGQEYLDKAYNLEQVEPDRKRLREKFGGE